MIDDRRVPGVVMGAARVLAPNDWTRTEIEVPHTPPSMNQNEIRSHWTGFQRHKKRWQTEIEQLLMLNGLARGGERAMAGAIMRFPKRARRDAGNFSGVVEKALGDALVNGRWISDDDATRYLFVGVEFDGEVGPNRTLLVVFTQPRGG